MCLDPRKTRLGSAPGPVARDRATGRGAAPSLFTVITLARFQAESGDPGWAWAEGEAWWMLHAPSPNPH